MTREEAIKLLVNATYSDEWQGNEDLTTAYNMAIKAIEEPSVNETLEKIRAEIEALEYLNIEDGSDGFDKYIEQYEVLKIIDKYKAESEVQDADSN